MTRRREQTVELAEALGLDVAAGEPTSELMDRCIARAEELSGIEPLEQPAPRRAAPILTQGAEVKQSRPRRGSRKRAA